MIKYKTKTTHLVQGATGSSQILPSNLRGESIGILRDRLTQSFMISDNAKTAHVVRGAIGSSQILPSNLRGASIGILYGGRTHQVRDSVKQKHRSTLRENTFVTTLHK
jgi:hypothetical protein